MRAKASARKRSTSDDVSNIGACGWAELSSLWDKIGGQPRKRIAGWSSGKAFEHLILRAFQLSGAEIIWPYAVNLHGAVVEQIDGMVLLDGIACMVEAKDQQANVNVEPLAKLRNQLLRRPAGVIGCVFSSSGFTDPAVTLVHYMAPHAILLWQGPEIGFLLERQDFADALRRKYRVLMQHGKPDFDPRAGVL